MSDVVENRVVEMRFDNKDFETNAAQSIRTLDELDKSLEFKNSSKGFSEIQNGLSRLDFSGLHDNISSIDNAFTSLAGSIERNFLDRISNGLLDMGEKLWSNTIGQIMSGGKSRALNIEQAKFKIKGLGKEWDDVKGDIDYAVSGTAYGLDAAASAAAQFLASGVKEGEDMKAALRGISGVAAMTSSDYQSISRVFTAAAGKGRVMAIELNRLSLRGINAAAAVGKYLGVTEKEVRELASDGQIDFQTFANAMDSAFGEHAKKANETFTGSLSNVKAALSRIGEIFYEPWIKNMIPVNNKIRESLNKIIEVLKAEVYPLGGKMKSFKDLVADLNKMMSRLVQEFIKSFDPFLSRLPYRLEHVVNGMKTIRHGLKSAVNTIKELNNMLENPWDFEVTLSKRLLKSNKKIKNEEWKLAREMVKAKQYDQNYRIQADEKQMKLIKEKGLSLEHVQSIVDSLTGKEQKYLQGITQAEINYARKIYNSGDYNPKKGIIYSEEAKAEMQELGLDAQRVQRYLDKLETGENKDIKRVFGHETAAKALLYLYQEMYNMEHLIGIVLKKLQRAGVAVVNAFRQIRKDFHPIYTEFPSITQFLIDVVKKFTIAGDRYKYIKSIAQGIFSIGELMIYGAKNVFTAISNILSETGQSQPFILKFLATFGDFFYKLAKAIILNEGEIPSAIDTFKKAFGGLFESLKGLISEEGPVRKFFTGVGTWISTAFEKIKTVLKGIFKTSEGEKGGLSSIFDMIISLFKPSDATLDSAGTALGKFFSKLGDIFMNLLDFAKVLTSHLGEVFEWLWGILQSQGSNISNLLSALFGFFTRLFNGEIKFEVFEKLKDVVIALADALIAIFTTIRDVVLAIKDPLASIMKSVAEAISAFSKAVSSVLGWITEDPEAAYGAAAFFAIIDLIGKAINKGVKNSNSWLKKLKAFPMTFKEFMGSLAQTLNKAMTETPADKLNKFATALLKMAIAVGILMFALTNGFGLGKDAEGNQGQTDNTSALIASLSTIAVFIIALLAIVSKLAKLGSATQDIKTGFITILLSQMTTAVLKIAISFAILAKVMDQVGLGAIIASAGLIVATLLIFVWVISIMTKNAQSLTGIGDKKVFSGMGTAIAMMGIAVSLIAGAFIKMMIAFAALKLVTGDTKSAMKVMIMIELFIVVIMGMLVVTIAALAAVAKDLSSINSKSLLGIGVILAIVGMVVKTIAKSVLKIAVFLAITDDWLAVTLSFGLVLAVLAFLSLVILAIGKAAQMGGGTDILKAALGFAALILMLGNLLGTMSTMVLMFKAAGVTKDDLDAIIIMITTLGVLLLAVGAGSFFLSKTGDGGKTFLLIAAGIALIAKAILFMAQAMAVVITTFAAFALIYPKIKPILPDMLEDMKTLVPEFIKVVGIGFRELLKEIMATAPLLAACIVEVITIIQLMLLQKAPMMVAKFLIVLDEIVTLLLVGAKVILPKLLALLLIFLGYLEANAVMLGERLTSILLKTFFGAFMAIAHFFDDFLPKWVDENFDKLNTGIIKWLSENSETVDKIGDFFYKMFEGKTREEDWAELSEGMVWDAARGYYVQADKVSTNVNVDSFEEARDKAKEDAQAEMAKIDEEPMEFEDVSSTAKLTNEELFEYAKGGGLSDAEVDAMTKDANEAVLAAAEQTKETAVKSEGEAGAEAANKYAEGFNFTLGDLDLSSALSDKFGGLVTKSGDSGKDAGNAFKSGFTNVLGDFDVGSLFGGGMTLDATNIADQYGFGNITSNSDFGWDPTVDSRGLARVGDFNDMNILGTDQTTSGALGIDAVTGNDNGGTLNMLSQLKALLSSLGHKVEDTIVIPKDSNINITTTIDKQVLGTEITPVVNAINGADTKKANENLASQRYAGAGGRYVK